MYLLDTNVVSEMRKARSGRIDHRVRKWANSVSSSTLFLSVISILELEIRIVSVERRDRPQGELLRAWMQEHVLPAFSNRILIVDTTVVQRCAALHVPAPRPYRDALIAATALVHGMTVVTRNVSDFKTCGVTLLNPWEE